MDLPSSGKVVSSAPPGRTCEVVVDFCPLGGRIDVELCVVLGRVRRKDCGEKKAKLGMKRVAQKRNLSQFTALQVKA
jgi:hypothetical protein